MKIYYNPKLKTLSRELRKKGVLSEVLLWNQLKAKKMKSSHSMGSHKMGYQFTRQKPIDNFIVDFFSNKLKLVIEIDGSSHFGKYKEDIRRQKKLEQLGLSFLRFRDIDIRENMSGVICQIEKWILDFENT
ncbi:MAG: endonuclease domain-containing protein [Candidatus Anammoxibacter sp.]